MTLSSSEMIVFDLDDTLYKEIDFVKSGFRVVADFVAKPDAFEKMISIWRKGGNAFQYLIDKFGVSDTLQELLTVYRNHYPNISLDLDTVKVLETLQSRGIRLGIISDGRSISQRNKIKALGLEKWISGEDVVISEEIGSVKPSLRNYEYFVIKYPNDSFSYVGDNLLKDFIAPNELGWDSICLMDDGRNIHKQNFNQNEIYLPQKIINSLLDLI